MVIFKEVKRLSEISNEAFVFFDNIMARKDINAMDVLYICSTLKEANSFFRELAHSYLSDKINKNKRCIELDNGMKIWVQPIMMLFPWVYGRRFKNIIFER